ncbi:MAG: DUF1028 domain-containing protein [Candidatus Hadarchaeales archaeon]
MTFSILVREGENFGVAVASGSTSVGERVPWAERGVGAVATQGLTETSYGPKGLELLRKGVKPEECLKRLLERDSGRELRQVLILGMGGAAAHTGSRCLPFAGHLAGEDFLCGGNFLAGERVLRAMVAGFRSGGSPIQRLLAALREGAKAGGDRRGERSAAILYATRRLLRFEVRDSEDPISELAKMVKASSEIL